MDEIVKICKIHGALKINEVYMHGKKNITCRKCKINNASKFRKKNPEKIKIYNKKYKYDNKEKIALSSLERSRRHRKNLQDCYIRAKLSKYSHLSCKDIPQELVELKRVQLQIRRHLKELKNGNK